MILKQVLEIEVQLFESKLNKVIELPENEVDMVINAHR